MPTTIAQQASYLAPLVCIYYFTTGRLRDIGWNWKWVFIAYIDIPIVLGILMGMITDIGISYFSFFIWVMFNLILLIKKPQP